VEKKDISDTSLEECALREVKEELFLDRERIRILGLFSDALSITNIAVSPVVGYVGDLDIASIRYNSEVAEVFSLSLEHLANPSNFKFESRSRTPTSKPMILPTFEGPHRIWGLTAIILYKFLKQIMKYKME